MSNSLEERLRSNSNAFDGLLALIPAKYYYDDATKDQWKAKKKSKAQVKLDKASKLDPELQDESVSTALEVLKKKEAVAKPVVLPGSQKPVSEEHVSETEEEEEEEEEEVVVVDVVFDDEGNKMDPVQEKPEEEAPKSKKQLSEQQKLQKQKNLEELRAKLQQKIQVLKEKRKAPGSKVGGAPASRDAILLQRKRKEELKKQRQQQQEQLMDEMDDSDSSSDSDMDDYENTTKQDPNLAKDVMFQNIVFDDGSKITSDLQRFRTNQGKKGPSKNDIKAHLKLVESRQKKIQSKDELAQIKLKEKEKWQKAMLLAEGVKLKDDEKLLRKALKRKETTKRRSAVEWQERERAVKTNIAERQKRREENLQIRKENKGKKRSKQQKMKRKFTGLPAPLPKKKQKRAGFEGRLKSGKKK